MPYLEILPHPALRAAVDRFWVRSGQSESEPEPQRILPDGCIDVLIGLDARAAHVVGTMTRALLVSSAPVATAAVRFRPGGAVAFLGVAAHELTDRRVPLADVGVRWLGSQVLGADTPLAAVELLEQCLLQRLAALAPPPRALAHVVRACFGSAPPPVAELARQLGWSRQRLTRALREQVGIGAKELLRVGRLQRAVDQLQRAQGSLALTAVGLGYFDQAHLCRDFRELVGVSPALVRASPRTIFPIRSLLEGA